MKSVGINELPNAALIQRVQRMSQAVNNAARFGRRGHEIIDKSHFQIAFEFFGQRRGGAPNLIDRRIRSNFGSADDLRCETFWQDRLQFSCYLRGTGKNDALDAMAIM